MLNCEVCCVAKLVEQLAVVPPLKPGHVQFQGPVPVVAVALPVVHILVVGATVNELPLLVPQLPLTGESVKYAVQMAVEPPFNPVHVQFQGPYPVAVVALPAAQKLVVGATANEPPLLDPQVPMIGGTIVTFTVILAVPPLPSETLTTKLSAPA